MSTYEERLVTFSSWPHASPSPEDMAKAGFSHEYMIFKDPDTVKCQICKNSFCDWEPADDPMQEHYRCSKSCMRLTEGDSTLMFVQDAMALPQKDAQASAQADLPAPPAPQPSPKDVGFLDPSLQHDFPDLCLFHDANTFCDRIERCISESGFLGIDILELLPTCLRGEALKWFKQSECQDLAACLGAMRARFWRQAPPEGPPEGPPQQAPQLIDYHHCKLCNASFSSIARLIRHTQENTCDKPCCRHCETVFSSKNRLHQHLREKCPKQTRSSSASSSASSSRSSSRSSSKSSFRSSSTWPSLSSTACSSTCSPISSPAPSPIPSPPLRYREISPSPSYLTITDLSARYARPPYLNIDDLFRMFGGSSATTKSSTIPTSARSFGVPIASAVASGHPPIRHRGRCQAKKGDGSSQAAKHLKPSKTPKTTKTKQQQNQKQKIGFARTSLQPALYKSVLPLQRSRSVSCPMAVPGSPSSHMRAPPQISPSPCIDYQCPTSGMSAL